MSPMIRRQPSGSSPGSSTLARQMAPLGSTGPPAKSTCGGLSWGSQSGSTCETGSADGLLSATPRAPSSSDSSMRMTDWSKKPAPLGWVLTRSSPPLTRC